VIARFILAVALAAVMVVVGTFSFIYLGSKQSKVAAPVEKPTVSSPRAQALVLPGTLYLTQSGALYDLSAGRFHQLTSEAGWTQPSAMPDGNSLVVVRQNPLFSDVYVMNRFGNVIRQVTANAAPSRSTDIGANHWSFYPRVSADGQTLWMTYDGLKCVGCYDLSLAVWSMPLNGSIRQAKAWTDGGFYTGGDVQPIPIPGAVIYTKYNYGPDGKLIGQLWITNRAGSFGRALTDPSVDCRTPSLSPDGTEFAMVCTYEKQISYLTLATWSGTYLGPLRTIVSNQLVAQPTWAPDGSGIAYLAPASPAGPFQLWWLPKAAYAPPPPSPSPSPTPGGPHNGPLPSPSPAPAAPPVRPIQLTTNNGFDATSPMVWLG
jgi:Tol biopolymer transport system component